MHSSDHSALLALLVNYPEWSELPIHNGSIPCISPHITGSTYQLIIFPEVVSFLAVSMTFSIPATHQHPSYLSSKKALVPDRKGAEGRDIRIVSLNFSGASFNPLNTAPSLPISLFISYAQTVEHGDVRWHPTRI